MKTSSGTAVIRSLNTLNQESYLLPNYCIIGSESDCHHIIQDPAISPHHCALEYKNGVFYIKDLSATFGTFVNNTRVIHAILQEGDILRLHHHEYVFSYNNITCSPPVPRWMRTNNEDWEKQLQAIPKAAQTEFPILILGESGTGKELISKSIHTFSTRADGPFVSINCSALTESLIESELFGHVKGSFTGATTDRKGAFEAARDGTLFLDEIGDLPVSLQPKILRALENSEIRPVGSDTSVQINVRIVAATHKNIKAQVLSGNFRQDLFYRLNVVTFNPPALRDRPEDFEEILYQFARKFRVRFSHNAIERLKAYSWPGNIRELKNFVARASALLPHEYIQPEQIDLLLYTQTEYTNLKAVRAHNNSKTHVLKDLEKELIINSLTANRGNQRKTAIQLGIPKSTLHDKIKAYHISAQQCAFGGGLASGF